MPAQQLDLGRQVTCQDIVALTCKHLAAKTAPLGNAALAELIGSPVTMTALRRLDEAALTGDLEATKRVGREVIWEIVAQLGE